MSILEASIKAAGGVGQLALALDVRQNVISNWRVRGVPKPWEKVLEMKYAPEATQPRAEGAPPTMEDTNA
jgi:hypothetical protein